MWLTLFFLNQFNHRNGFIYTLIHMKVKNNKIIFSSGDWITIVPLTSDNVDLSEEFLKDSPKNLF